MPTAHRRIPNRLLQCSLVGVLLLTASCATSRHLSDNKKAAHDLSVLFRLDEQGDFGWDPVPLYPATYSDLKRQLKASGFDVQIPQCRCADGKMRDFLFVPGFLGSAFDGNDRAFIFSPPEMDPSVTIVVYLDGRVALLSREAAANEMEKSRAYTKDRLARYEKKKA